MESPFSTPPAPYHLSDELSGDVLRLDDFREQLFAVDLGQLDARRHDGVRIAGRDADEPAIGLQLSSPRRLGVLRQQPVDEHLRRARVWRAVEQPEGAA